MKYLRILWLLLEFVLDILGDVRDIIRPWLLIGIVIYLNFIPTVWSH